MNFRRYNVPLAVRMILGLPVAGFAVATHAADTAEQNLQTVRISATAVDEDPNNITSSFSVLQGERLRERTQATLGDTLDSLPGVRADTFGGGSTRPVIRGQTAPRVKVLSDSATLLDASDISPDHAVTTEPFLIDRIEVLRGPATLLYGSGAIGGVVNVLDKKIPTTLPSRALQGAVGLRGATVSSEQAAMAELSARAGDHLVFHLEGATRDADDYRVPDFAERRAVGTRAKSSSGSAGLSFVGDDGYLGLAYSYRDDDYGLPGHNHEFEGCHPHGSALHCGSHEAEEGEHDHDHESEEHEFPTIALLTKRFDLRGEIRDPVAGIERIRVRASHTDYQHEEIEEQEVATTFLNDGYEARVELQHMPILGWRGVAGAQYSDTEFSALGEEAFLPVTKSDSLGLFVVEHYELNEAWHLEAGLRQEWQKHRPVNDERGRPEISDSGTSLSLGAVWEFSADYFATLSASRSERLPFAQELYARGIHLATNTYECGLVPHPLTCGGPENNADIRTETSQNVGLSLRKAAGDVTFEVGGFYNDVDDYIYARTLDQFEEFRLIKYTQADARFTGLEAEATYRFAGNLSATIFGDYVRAQLRGGEDLPRIPAARIGTRFNASVENYRGELEYFHVDQQNDIADYELPTPGYNMLNLTLSYGASDGEGLSVYLRGTNLLNELVWNHSSFLANVVPLPGRNLNAGLRFSF
jgi:iron complex outermembrane receptor protein